ncbi:MAG: hypothetical protein EB127_07595 [Alphaproteobacteria bacterium]|nr:hypothetical protein [Alphaproteobacteria bacterium]
MIPAIKEVTPTYPPNVEDYLKDSKNRQENQRKEIKFVMLVADLIKKEFLSKLDDYQSAYPWAFAMENKQYFATKYEDMYQDAAEKQLSFTIPPFYLSGGTPLD